MIQNEKIFDNINQVDIFKSLNNEELKAIFKQIHYQIKKFEKDEIIIHTGQKCENLKIILNGSVHTEMNNYGEKIIKIADLVKGQSIAISFVFGTNNTMPVNVIADETTEILTLSKDTIRKIFLLNNKIFDSYIEIVSNQTQYLAKKIKFLNFNTIKEKLLFFLNEQQHQQKTNIIKLKITQQILADLFGVTRPSLARAIKNLEKDNIIQSLPNKRIKIIQ